MTPEEKNRAMLMFQNHNSDPVGGLPIVGGNPGTGGTIPEGSSGFVQAVRAATGRDITVHNCYGKGDPKGGCEKFWVDSPTGKPISQPARPELIIQGTGK